MACTILREDDSFRYEGHFEPTGYHDICAGAERSLDMSAGAIPDGATVTLSACVVLGKDNTSDEFLYTKNSDETAIFVISGTTLHNKLVLEQVQ